MGLALARALEPSRFTLALVDAGAPPSLPPATEVEVSGAHVRSGVDPRVSAMSPSSVALLTRLGGLPSGEFVCPFTRMSVWDAGGTGRIEFDAGEIKEPALGTIVENRRMLVALLSAAMKQDNLEIRHGTTIAAIERSTDGYTVDIGNGETIECSLLVGADGGNSIVRKACGIRSVTWEYDQKAIVTTVMTEAPHRGVAHQRFLSTGPLALLPLASDNLVSIVWSSTRAESLLALTDEDFCEQLSEASEFVLGRVVATDDRFAFGLRQAHAVRYVRPHLVLVGDAAHTIHPLAGQGANLGLADVSSLAGVLNDCHFSGQSPGDIHVLRRYERARAPANAVTGLAMEAFKRLYGNEHPLVIWARNAGTRMVGASPNIKSLLMRWAAGR